MLFDVACMISLCAGGPVAIGGSPWDWSELGVLKSKKIDGVEEGNRLPRKLHKSNHTLFLPN